MAVLAVWGLAGTAVAGGPFQWGGDRFLLTGYAFAGYKTPPGDEVEIAGLAPIFLVRPASSVLLEVEPVIELELGKHAGGTERELEVKTALEYAQVDLFLHDSVTLVVGKFLTPVGQFQERLHPAWINKIPTAPAAFDAHGGLLPGSQVGGQIRGAVALGEDARVKYAAFVSQGPRLASAGMAGGAMMAPARLAPARSPSGGGGGSGGGFDTAKWDDNNSNKAFGGRLGVVPVGRLEVGGSYFAGTYDDHGELAMTWVAGDASFHTDLWEVRGEVLRRAKEEEKMMVRKTDADTGYYGQVALKLSVLPWYVFNPVEAVVRYGEVKPEHGSGTTQLTAGLNYALGASSFVRLAWEQTSGHDSSVIAMLAHGF